MQSKEESLSLRLKPLSPEPYRPQLSFNLDLGPPLPPTEQIRYEEAEPEPEPEPEAGLAFTDLSLSNSAVAMGSSGGVLLSPGSPAKGSDMQPMSLPPNGAGVEEENAEAYYPPRCWSHVAVVQDGLLFVQALARFLPAIGARLTVPKLGGKELDLHHLYKEVTSRGGLEEVIRYNKWREITSSMDILLSCFNASFVLRKHYINLLYHFEQSHYFGAQGRLVPPPVPLPAPCSVDNSVREVQDGGLSISQERMKIDSKGDFGVDPVVSIGNTITGAINGKIEEGYLVTVVIGGEKLSGYMYSVSPDRVGSLEQFASVPGLLDGVDLTEFESSQLEVDLPQKRRREHRKDPNLPRSTRSGYIIFCRELRAKRKQMPRHEIKELKWSVYEMWRRLPEEEKLLYNERGNRERENYIKGFSEISTQKLITGPDAIVEHEPETMYGGAFDAIQDYHVSLDEDNSFQAITPFGHNMEEDEYLNETNTSREQASESEHFEDHPGNKSSLEPGYRNLHQPTEENDYIPQGCEGAQLVHLPPRELSGREDPDTMSRAPYCGPPGPNYGYSPQLWQNEAAGKNLENSYSYRTPLPLIPRDDGGGYSTLVERNYYAQNGFVPHYEQGPMMQEQMYRLEGGGFSQRPGGGGHAYSEVMYRPHGSGFNPHVDQEGGGARGGHLSYREQGFIPTQQGYMPQGGGMPYYHNMQPMMPHQPSARDMQLKNPYPPPPDLRAYPIHPPPPPGYLLPTAPPPYAMQYPHAIPYPMQPHPYYYGGRPYANQYGMRQETPSNSAPLQFTNQGQEGAYPPLPLSLLPTKEGGHKPPIYNNQNRHG